MTRLTILFLLALNSYSLSAQHIVVRTPDRLPVDPAPQAKPKDTLIVVKKQPSKQADTSGDSRRKNFTMKSMPIKRKIDEFITECDFRSQPDKVPQLPYVTNFVEPAIIDMLKKKYEGKLYSITGLVSNTDEQHFKLRVCRKGKLEVEYVNEKGTVIENPTLDTF